MGKYVATEFDELVHSINPKIKALRNQLKSYEGSGQEFVDMDSFKGSGAENAKDYYHSAQIPAAKTFSILAGDIQKKAKKIQDDFRDNVDANPNAVYDSDFLEDYLSKGKANKKALDQTIRDINAAIESANFRGAEKLKPSSFNDHFDEWEKEVKKAKEKFDDFRTDNTKTWESLEERTKSFEIVIKGFGYSKQHGGVAAYSGNTKSMLKMAIMNAKSVGEVEKESGIKKPKNMSQKKYKALVEKTEEAMSHAPKSVKGKKAKEIYKQYLASQLAEAKQKDWDKTVKAVNKEATTVGSELFVQLKNKDNAKMPQVSGGDAASLNKARAEFVGQAKKIKKGSTYKVLGGTRSVKQVQNDVRMMKDVQQSTRVEKLAGHGVAGKIAGPAIDGVDTYMERREKYGDKSAAIDGGVHAGITAGATAIGAAVGSAIPIPGVGTLLGMYAGHFVGTYISNHYDKIAHSKSKEYNKSENKILWDSFNPLSGLS